MVLARLTFTIALMLALVGCASTPVNSDPSCQPCSNFLKGTEPEVCPYQPVAVPTDAKYTNLVFEGGGVKGTAFGGSLAVLAGSGLLDPIERVAGTSAGALTALMVSLGYSAEEMHRIIMTIDFKKFEDGSFLGDVERLKSDYGWYKGDYALCLLECIVKRKTGHRKTTFAELYAMKKDHPGFRDLYVFGTDVNRQSSVEFSRDNHADVPLADAARISMSIPFFFAARVLGDDVFVDGGVLNNYPITTFDDSSPLEDTLGFHLGTEPHREKFHNVIDFTGGVFSTLLDQQVAQLCEPQRENVKRSVFINTLGVGTIDFSISDATKCELIRSGTEATVRYLEEEIHSEECPPAFIPSPSGTP